MRKSISSPIRPRPFSREGRANRVSKLASITFGVLVLLFVVGFYALSWSGPTANPPLGNRPAPLPSTGSTSTGPIVLTAGGGDALKIKEGGDLRIYTPDNTGSAKLYVDSNGILTVAGQVKITGGSPGTGKVLTSDDATGLASWQTPVGGAGEAYWILSGNNLYASSTAWNVGIGTADAGTYKLKVAGTANITGNTDIGGDLTVSGTGGNICHTVGGTWYSCPPPGEGGVSATGTPAAGQVSFFTDATTITGDSNLYWDNTNKRLGIGTSTPAYPWMVDILSPAYGIRVRSTTNSGYAYLSDGDYGIFSYGDIYGIVGRGETAGGYFLDHSNSGYALVGYGDYGIYAQGNTMGGYFKDRNNYGYAYLGSGDYGIEAYTTSTGWAGVFENPNTGVRTLIAGGSNNRGIDALAPGIAVGGWGDTSGGYFQDHNNGSTAGYAYVGYGNWGIIAFGGSAGGYFKDQDNYGKVYAGYGNYGLLAYSTSTADAGVFKNDMSGIYTRLADNDSGIETNGAIVVNDSAGTSGQVLTSQGASTPPVWADAPAVGFTSRVRAYRSDEQSIPNQAWTKVQLNAESYDGLGEFDPTTNFRFTAQTAGYYQVNAAVWYIAVDATVIYIAIYKNGSNVAGAATRNPTTGGDFSSVISDVIYLAAGDYLELYTYHGSTSAKSAGYGAAWTYMSIHKLSE